MKHSRPLKLPSLSTHRLWSHYRHSHHCHFPPSPSLLTASSIADENLTLKENNAGSPRSHHPFTKLYRVRHALGSHDIIMRIGVIPTTLNLIWWLTETEVHRVRRILPMHKLVFSHKLLEIKIVERAFRNRFSRIPHHLI